MLYAMHSIVVQTLLSPESIPISSRDLFGNILPKPALDQRGYARHDFDKIRDAYCVLSYASDDVAFTNIVRRSTSPSQVCREINAYYSLKSGELVGHHVPDMGNAKLVKEGNPAQMHEGILQRAFH